MHWSGRAWHTSLLPLQLCKVHRIELTHHWPVLYYLITSSAQCISIRLALLPRITRQQSLETNVYACSCTGKIRRRGGPCSLKGCTAGGGIVRAESHAAGPGGVSDVHLWRRGDPPTPSTPCSTSLPQKSSSAVHSDIWRCLYCTVMHFTKLKRGHQIALFQPSSRRLLSL